MGEGGVAYAILIAAWVTSWGAQSGKHGEGGRLGHGGDVVFFLMSDAFICGVDIREEGKIRSDLKNCNASWTPCFQT